MQGDALVVRYLLEGRLGRDDDEGRAAFESLVREYREALSNVPTRPGQLDSVLSQFEILSRFYDVYAVARRDPAYRLVADRLLELVRLMRPGRAARTHRPVGVRKPEGGNGSARGATKSARQRRGRGRRR